MHIPILKKYIQVSIIYISYFLFLSVYIYFSNIYIFLIVIFIIATDNCTAALTVGNIIATWGIESYGLCFENKFTNKDNINPRNQKNGGAIQAIVDIEMLRNGKEFFGLFDSNFVRMVHRLRYPHLNHSHALATETYPVGEDQRETNRNMFDFHWVDRM